jgi:hypothetical protein
MQKQGMAKTTLFLDFDGVLHPRFCPDEEHFCRRQLFESVMRRHPAVRIVISSSWRRVYGIDYLRSRFSRDIAERVVGTTQLWVPDEPTNRHQEILAWLGKQRLEGSPWVALDDSAQEFPKRCVNLLLCDSRHGLTDERAEALARRLSELAGE